MLILQKSYMNSVCVWEREFLNQSEVIVYRLFGSLFSFSVRISTLSFQFISVKMRRL